MALSAPFTTRPGVIAWNPLRIPFTGFGIVRPPLNEWTPFYSPSVGKTRRDPVRSAIDSPGRDPLRFASSGKGRRFMQHCRNYIDGEWVESATGKTLDVINPATREVIARVPDSGPADVDRAVGAARRAFDSDGWPRTSARERGRI